MMFERKDLTALTLAQLAPLEALMHPAWSDTWRDLATSCYVTLLSAPGAAAVAQPMLAQLAVALALGIADDLGGTQPYIAVGAGVASSARTLHVVQLLRQGLGYKAVADATGLTVSHVRRIERAWRQEQWAQRQDRLPLDDPDDDPGVAPGVE